MFAHKGSVAYCLSRNNEKQKCFDFAEENNYLQRICDLEEGEIIAKDESENMKEYFNTDGLEPIKAMKYSDLI